MDTQNSLNQYIDHTLLKPQASGQQIQKLCQEAMQHNFATVCINPSMVALAAKELKGSQVKVCTVVGFPLGATLPEVKAFETKKVIELGAREIDMVINIGALKDDLDQQVKEDIEAVVKAAGEFPVKVIIETALLNDDEKKRACQLALEAGASFVKTSTGLSGGGATTADIELMKEAVESKIQVKASGGIRDKKSALNMIKAGATRLGTSSGVALVSGQKTSGDY